MRSPSKKSILRPLKSFRSGVKRSDKQSLDLSRSRRDRPAAILKRISFATALVSVCVVLVWVAYSTRITEVDLRITTDTTSHVPVDQASVRASINNYLSESFLNRWLINHEQLANKVKLENNAVNQLTLELRQGNTLSFHVEGRRRILVWQKGERYYEVDSSAVAFRETTKDNVKDNVLVIDRSRLPVEVGANVTSPSFVAAIDQLNTANGGRSKPLEIMQFIAPDAPRELHLKLKGQPFTVKTLVAQDPDVVLQSISDSLAFFNKEGGVPKTVLDLRVDGRAVYQ